VSRCCTGPPLAPAAAAAAPASCAGQRALPLAQLWGAAAGSCDAAAALGPLPDAGAITQLHRCSSRHLPPLSFAPGPNTPTPCVCRSKGGDAEDEE
jgi:hypothetical protein